MNTQCIFCATPCEDGFCLRYHEMNRGKRFARLLRLLQKASESVMYYDEIVSVVKQIQNVSFFWFY